MNPVKTPFFGSITMINAKHTDYQNNSISLCLTRQSRRLSPEPFRRYGPIIRITQEGDNFCVTCEKSSHGLIYKEDLKYGPYLAEKKLKRLFKKLRDGHFYHDGPNKKYPEEWAEALKCLLEALNLIPFRAPDFSSLKKDAK